MTPFARDGDRLPNERRGGVLMEVIVAMAIFVVCGTFTLRAMSRPRTAACLALPWANSAAPHRPDQPTRMASQRVSSSKGFCKIEVSGRMRPVSWRYSAG